MPCIAAAIALAITALLVTVVFVAINVPSSHTFKLVYTPFIAIAASTITLWISSQIRHLFLVRLDAVLCLHGRPIDRLNSRWRAVLGVSAIGEKLRKHHAVTSVFIVGGLISASINAGLALSIATKSIVYSSSIPDGLVYDCVKYADATTSLDAKYQWKRLDGKYFCVWPNLGTCPPRYAVALMNNINTQNPDEFAYADQGVAVDRSAIGAPYTIYSSNPTISPNLSLALVQHGEDLLEITHCVPVMSSNPVSCRTGGSIVLNSSTGAINVSSEYCYENNPIKTGPPAMSMGICMHDEIGQATMVLGGIGGYAVELAYSIGDRTIQNDTRNDSISYAVTCEVDTRSVIQYRAVKLSMQGRNGFNGSFARALTSVGPCPSPPSPNVISEVYIGVAAMASWQVLYQGWGYDGYFEAISEKALDSVNLGDAGVPRNLPFAFPGSKSGLEDVLGLNAGLVLSQLNSNTTTVEGIATIRFSRVGSASRFTLIYALPSLISFVALAWLILTTPALDHRLRSTQLEELKLYLWLCYSQPVRNSAVQCVQVLFATRIFVWTHFFSVSLRIFSSSAYFLFFSTYFILLFNLHIFQNIFAHVLGKFFGSCSYAWSLKK